MNRSWNVRILSIPALALGISECRAQLYRASDPAIHLGSGAVPLLAELAGTLPEALSEFDQEHDRVKKERDLRSITQQHPEAGPALLELAQRTRFTDTRWMAMWGMRDVHFKGCEDFLKRELKSPEAIVRSNAARVIGDLELQSASAELSNMFAAEEDPGAIQQASLSLRNLNVRTSAPLIRQKIPLFAGQTRGWLLQAIGKLGDRTDVPVVATYLYDSDWGVQPLAAQALAELTGISFGGFHEGFSPVLDDQTVKARDWWSEHRKNWPDCSDCR